MWFKNKNANKITVEFKVKPDGSLNTTLQLGKDISVVDALTAINRIKGNITHGLQKRVADARFGKRDPKQAAFVRELKIKDIL